MADKLLYTYKRLIKAGYTIGQIKEKLGVNDDIFLSIVNKSLADNRRLYIDLKQYIDVITSNICQSKEELARKLNTSKPTLINFENQTGILRLLCQCWHIQGKTQTEINKSLFTRTEKSCEYINEIPTLAQVAEDIQTIINTYEMMAEYDNSYIHKISELKRLKNKIEAI